MCIYICIYAQLCKWIINHGSSWALCEAPGPWCSCRCRRVSNGLRKRSASRYSEDGVKIGYPYNMMIMS